MTRQTLWALLSAMAVIGGLARQAGAGVCTVPGTHGTIQAAVDDPTCTAIQLAAMGYAESVTVPRSLSIAGPMAGGAVVEGRFRGTGAGTVVALADLAIESGCSPQAAGAIQGARIEGLGLEVTRQAGLACPEQLLFEDGFESGDTMAWDTTVR